MTNAHPSRAATSGDATALYATRGGRRVRPAVPPHGRRHRHRLHRREVARQQADHRTGDPK